MKKNTQGPLNYSESNSLPNITPTNKELGFLGSEIFAQYNIFLFSVNTSRKDNTLH